MKLDGFQTYIKPEIYTNIQNVALGQKSGPAAVHDKLLTRFVTFEKKQILHSYF